MIDNNKKISATQLFCLLVLTRIAGEIVIPRTSTTDAAAAICAAAIAEVIQLLFALPAIVYSFRGNDFYGAICRKNRFLGFIVGLSAALLMTSSAVMAMIYSSEFTIKNLLIGGSMCIIFIITAVFAVYSVFMGAEAAARSGAIFLVIAIIISVIVVIADIPYMKLPDERVAFDFEFLSFVEEVIKDIPRGGDYLIFTAFLPYIAKKNTRSSGRCGLLFGLTAIIVVSGTALFNCFVLREFYGAVEYPFIAAASLSDIAFFKRLDGAAAAVWVLCAAFRSGVLLICAFNTVQNVFQSCRHERSVQ